ncbi:hypothetical protein L798_12509 [Zootermopsis nevadensis]|uniref:Uncharacterized protein n=1 Tax=Zootermopsis nevadensis TaxID=136037 RepID=A0A067QS77_ZOONE|nr:hypothetical protein L798_12509 [Zootermopsis nevadensis]
MNCRIKRNISTPLDCCDVPALVSVSIYRKTHAPPTTVGR